MLNINNIRFYSYFVLMKITGKTLRKIAVYFILVVFLSSTALMSVMYFIDMNSKNAQVDSGSVATDTSLTGIVTTGVVNTGVVGSGN